MAVYNGGQFLSESIESVLQQTQKDFEFVIINDGSTDKSRAVIDDFAKKDSRIRAYHQRNHGLVFSLNRGIKLARGKYIARQDADDISLPTRLQKQLNFMRLHPNIALLGTAFTAVDEKGNKIYTFHTIPDSKAVKLDIIVRNPFGHGTAMFNKTKIVSLGGYAKLKYTEDYDLWSRVIQKYQAANLTEPLYKWRLVESSMSHSRHLQNQEIIINLKKQIWQNSLPPSKIKLLVDQVAPLLKSYKKTDAELLLNMFVALYFYVLKKNQLDVATHIWRVLLKTRPISALRTIKKAQNTQILDGYDIRRICSDARGQIYDK